MYSFLFHIATMVYPLRFFFDLFVCGNCSICHSKYGNNNLSLHSEVLQVLGYSDTDAAEYLYKKKPQLDALVNFVCQDLTGACSSKPPPIPKVVLRELPSLSIIFDT